MANAEERIKKAVSDVKPEDLRSRARKTEHVGFRATPTEKESIFEIAEALEMSVGDYLSTLHTYAEPRLRKRRK